MIPSADELAAVLADARTRVADPSAKPIEIGCATDLDRPIGELISENKRFIIIDDVSPDICVSERSLFMDEDDLAMLLGFRCTTRVLGLVRTRTTQRHTVHKTLKALWINSTRRTQHRPPCLIRNLGGRMP